MQYLIIILLLYFIILYYYTLLFLSFSYLKSKQSFWTKQGLKTENIFVSFLHNFSLIFNGEKLRRQQGKLFGFYRGLTLILNCGDADVLRFILSKDFHIFTNRRVNCFVEFVQ